MAAHDSFLLAVVTKGRSCTGGGRESGIELQGTHSVALSWAEVLRFAAVQRNQCPMLTVVAVAPVLVAAGRPYALYLDHLLGQASSGARGVPTVQMVELAEEVVREFFNEDEDIEVQGEENETSKTLSHRELLHIRALHHLLQQDPQSAVAVYLRILRLCPGDLLAMALSMDASHALGDRQAALR